MSRRLALAATAAVIALASTGPAAAWPFGKKDGAKADPAKGQSADKPTGKPGQPALPTVTPPPRPQKATPTERAAAQRLDPLARAAFWNNEFSKDPADAEAGVQLAKSLRGLGRNDQAAAAASQVLVTQPNNVEALLEVARAHIARGQAFYAIEPAQRAAAAAPRDWRPLSILGVAYDHVSRPDEAKAAWNQALKLSPDNPAVLSNLAMAYMAAGDAPQAETLLRKAVVQPGATLQVSENLALVLGLQGKMAEAERIIRTNLPPELAEQNLAWIRARSTGAAGGARSWQSVQGSN